jgi:hypothetical protein
MVVGREEQLLGREAAQTLRYADEAAFEYIKIVETSSVEDLIDMNNLELIEADEALKHSVCLEM